MRVDPPPAAPRGPMQTPSRTVERRPCGPTLTWRGAYDRAFVAAPVLSDDAQPAFTAASAIGEAAVRFDARPIVAPVAEPVIPVADPDFSLPEEFAASGDPVPLTAVDMSTSMPTIGHDTTHTNRIGGTDANFTASRTALSSKIHHGSHAPIAPPASRVSVIAKPAMTTSGAVTRAAMSATPGATARVAVTPDAIRIAVPGAVLSDEDTSTLLQAARETVDGTSLAGRPIRIIGRKGAQ